MQKEILITKANGESEPFQEEKLRASLRRSGAEETAIEEVVSHILAELKPGMTTQKIYQHAYQVLKREKKVPASVRARYSLRKAMMDLGPSGFPFERFLGKVLESHGYKTQVGGMLEGACVEHEVDVLAENDHQHVFVEAKYHNRPGIKTDLKVALYVRARFEDIERQHQLKAEREGRPGHMHEGWLVTNTKLTSKAIQYSECIGQTVIGWNYPKEGNLQDLIEQSSVHPLTCLSTLSQKQKNHLLQNDIVLCRDVVTNPDILHAAGVSNKKRAHIEEEVANVCVPRN